MKSSVPRRACFPSPIRILFASFLILSSDISYAQEQIRPGTSSTITLPPDEDERSFLLDIDTSGTLLIWIEPSKCQTKLALIHPNRKGTIEDADADADGRPFLALDAEAANGGQVKVAKLLTNSTGEFVLRVELSEDTEETLREAARVSEVIERVRELRQSGDLDLALETTRKQVKATVDHMKAHPSHRLARSLSLLGVQAFELRAFSIASQAWECELDLLKDLLPRTHGELLRVHRNLGLALRSSGRPLEAVHHYQEALAAYVVLHPPEHLTVLELQYQVGLCYDEGKEYEAGKRVLEVAVPLIDRSAPRTHWLRVNAPLELGHALCKTGGLDGLGRALELTERAMEAGKAQGLDEDDWLMHTALNNLGWIQMELGMYGAARPTIEEAIALRSRVLPAHHVSMQKSRINLGHVLSKLEEYEKARETYSEVLEIWLKVLPEHYLDVLEARANLARAHTALGEDSEARALMQRILTSVEGKPTNRLPVVRQTRNLLVSALIDEGELQRAEELLLQPATDSAPMPEDRAWSAFEAILGYKLLAANGDPQAALPRALETLDALEVQVPSTHEAFLLSLQSVSWIMSKSGDLPKHCEYLERYLGVLVQIYPSGHPMLEALRTCLGCKSFEIGNTTRAIHLLREAAVNTRMSLPPSNRRRIEALLNYCMVSIPAGIVPEPLAQFQEAHDAVARERPQDPVLGPLARICLGIACLNRGDAAGASESLQAALSAEPADAEELASYRGFAASLLAATFIQMGDLESAIVAFDEIAKTAPEPFARVIMPFLCSLASMARDDANGLRPDDGRPAPQLSPDSPLQAVARLHEAFKLMHAGKPESAIACADGVLNGTDMRILQLQSEVIKGLCFAKVGRMRESEEMLGQGLRDWPAVMGVPARLGLESLLVWVQTSLTHDLRTRQRMKVIVQDALSEILDRELDLSPYRASLAWNTLTDIASAGLALQDSGEGFSADLFSLMETARTQDMTCHELLTLVDQQTVFDPSLAELRRVIRDASEEIALASHFSVHDVVLIRERKLGAQRQLIKKLTAIDPTSPLWRPASFKALQASLHQREAAIGFWRYERWSRPDEGRLEEVDHYGAWLIPHEGPLQWVDLGPADELEAAASSWLRSIHLTSEPGDWRRIARVRGTRLRQILLDPVLKALGPIDRLIVAPDEIIHLLPLDSLPVGEGPAEVLGDRVRLIVVNRLRGLEHLKPEANGTPSLLLLGGIDYDHPPEGAPGDPAYEFSADVVGELPGTLSEVREIEETFQRAWPSGTRHDLLHQDGATKSQLEAKSREVRYLHLATHAWFNETTAQRGTGSSLFSIANVSPMALCGLALSGANLRHPTGRSLGIITAEELSALPLSHCELAVLSACETAIGKSRSGQGLSSLQKALATAGARHSLTSLWKVPDAATSKLMREFYRRIWELGESKRQALWAAKKMLRDAQDANGERLYGLRDWAGWVVCGPPESEDR